MSKRGQLNLIILERRVVEDGRQRLSGNRGGQLIHRLFRDAIFLRLQELERQLPQAFLGAVVFVRNECQIRPAGVRLKRIFGLLQFGLHIRQLFAEPLARVPRVLPSLFQAEFCEPGRNGIGEIGGDLRVGGIKRDLDHPRGRKGANFQPGNRHRDRPVAHWNLRRIACGLRLSPREELAYPESDSWRIAGYQPLFQVHSVDGPFQYRSTLQNSGLRTNGVVWGLKRTYRRSRAYAPHVQEIRVEVFYLD